MRNPWPRVGPQTIPGAGPESQAPRTMSPSSSSPAPAPPHALGPLWTSRLPCTLATLASGSGALT